MAKKQIRAMKSRKTAAKSTQAHKQRQVGNGTFALAGKRIGEVLGKIYSESQQLQAKARTLTKEVAADLHSQLTGFLVPLTAQVEQGAIRVGASVERGFGEVLSRLGIASKHEIVALSQRVSALSRQLKTAK